MKHLKKQLSLFLVFVMTIGTLFVLPAEVYADDDYWDTHKKCLRCDTITDDFCDTCASEHYGVCDSCHEFLHCGYCDGCYVNMDVEPCDDACFGAYCLDCAQQEGHHCNECGECYTGREDELCGNCFLCPDHVNICSECGWCYECQPHCPECLSCDYEGFECPEGGEHCQACCSVCDQCGECIIGKEIDVCGYCLLCEECCEANACESCGMCAEDSEYDEHLCEACGRCMTGDAARCEICGLCVDCCVEEAVSLGCECGEYCWTEVSDEHICADCGECFGVVDPCPTCESAGEYRCVSCCGDLSVSLGCDCISPVCVNDPNWETHLETEHVGADNAHAVVPQAAWSADETYHYKGCRLCSETSHVSSKGKHSFDEKGKCRVCDYVSGQGIFITRQPVGRTVDVSDSRNSGVYTTATFNVSASAKNALSYQWQYSSKKDFSSDVRDFTDASGSTGSKTNGFTYAVAFDDCAGRYGALHNEMYIRCRITDGKTTVYSGVVTLTVRHVYDDTANVKKTAEGHAYKCRGEGCVEYEDLKPHQFGTWTWNADHTERTAACEICGYKNIYRTHKHAVNWDDPAFDGGWTCTDEWAHEYEITVNGKQYKQDLLRHTGVCSVAGCTQEVIGDHIWGPMTPRNPGSEPTKASHRYQVHRVCTVCGYDDTKMKYDGTDGSSALFWMFGVHPVTVVNGTMDNRYGMVRDGASIVLTADRKENKTFTGWKIDYRKLEGSTYVNQTVTVKTSNLDTIRNTAAYQGWFPENGRFNFKATDFVMPAMGDAGMWTFTAQYANTCKHPSKVTENAKAATCTQMGYSGDRVCFYCGILFSAGQETDALGHGELKAVEKDVPALDRNGEVRTDKRGNPIYIARAASVGDCTTRGYTGDKICTVCGEVAEQGSSTGFIHNWKECSVIKEGTATEKGLSEFECTECGAVRQMPTDYSGPDYRLVPDRNKVFFSFNFGDKVTPVEITVTPKGRNADEIRRVEYFEPAGERNYIVKRTGDWSFTVEPDMTLASEDEFEFQNIISAYVEMKDGKKTYFDLVDVNMNPVKSKEKYKITVLNGEANLWSTATGKGVLTPVSEARSGETICIRHDKSTFIRWEVVSDPSGLVKETLEKHNRLTEYDTSFLMPPNDVVVKAVFVHDHAWDGGKITTPATCAKEGVKTFTCTVCKVTKTEPVAKSATHTWDGGKITTPATCAKEGVKTFTCAVCKTTKTEPVAKTATHTWDGGKITTPATCAKEGVKTFTCAVCKTTKTEPAAKTADHKWDGGKVTTPATCAKEGVKTFTCTVCKATKTEPVAKTADHKWDGGKVTTPATYTAKGTKTFTCTVCAATRTEDVPQLVEPVINGESAKEVGGVVLAVPGSGAGALLNEAGSGASLFTPDGKPVDVNAALSTGMTLVKPGGKKMTVVVLGDVDGDSAVTAADARLALRRAVNLETFAENTPKFIACNANLDETVTAADARLILRAAVSLEKLKLS